MAHSWKVLKDWARLAGVPMNFPSRWHPAKSVAAMRFCCAPEADQAALARFARGAFASYFDRQENLDDPAVLAAVAAAEGLPCAPPPQAATGEAAQARVPDTTNKGTAPAARCPPPNLVP